MNPQGAEDSWQRLLEVTGAQEGSADPAIINAAHTATGVPVHSPCLLTVDRTHAECCVAWAAAAIGTHV